MLFYRAAVDLSHQTLNYVAGMIRRHRKTIGSIWRRLNPGQQALLVLVYLHKGETYTELATGFGVSTATAWRYVEETVALLSARSPKLGQALRKARRDGLHYLVLDGTLIRTDRIKTDRPYFSGKHRVHGMNSSPDGQLMRGTPRLQLHVRQPLTSSVRGQRSGSARSPQAGPRVTGPRCRPRTTPHGGQWPPSIRTTREAQHDGEPRRPGRRTRRSGG
ncbi:helix-turn-helix domain-containing protein [Nonomuraea jabiensis]|uniref:helix-turn-helix domain-containing protein n=1 Tax=Nonomuraea jabiensis TaxID=882448 RepID=UPI003D728618